MRFRSLLCFFMLMFCSAQLWADHMVGSDIVYKCLGNGKYLITLRVYRDCNGIPLSTTPMSASCSSATFSVSVSKISVRDITGIDAKCPVQSRCSGSYPYGVEEHVFTATVDLSSYSCCEFTFSWG